jgi:hypothetical protein
LIPSECVWCSAKAQRYGEARPLVQGWERYQPGGPKRCYS